MTDAPEKIWITPHLGEYGRYYPEAVEAEGEHGGKAVAYVPQSAERAAYLRGLEDAAKVADVVGFDAGPAIRALAKEAGQ